MRRFKTQDLLKQIQETLLDSGGESWDVFGLVCGSLTSEVKKATAALDWNHSLIQWCKAQEISHVFVHHPPLFPQGKGPTRHTEGDLVYDTIRSGIELIALHTHYDRFALSPLRELAKNMGVSRLIGRLLGPDEKLFLFAVYVPETHAVKVREALGSAGAGRLGHYQDCSFESVGTGSFSPLSGARPAIGRALGGLERVAEAKIEVLVPGSLRGAVWAALKEAHPYEEIAHHWVELSQPSQWKGFHAGVGYGFVGELEEAIPCDAWVDRLKKVFGIQACQVSFPRPNQVRTVAFSPGQGKGMLDSAVTCRADVFVTGELGYHEARVAASRGLCTVQLGHTQSEVGFFFQIEEWSREWGFSYESVPEALRHCVEAVC